MEKLTYENFKIGQYVVCVKLCTDNSDADFWEQHLTIGKKYKIKDLDFHFYDKVCIKSDRRIGMFVPIELFSDNKYVRKLKLKKINGNIDR